MLIGERSAYCVVALLKDVDRRVQRGADELRDLLVNVEVEGREEERERPH